MGQNSTVFLPFAIKGLSSEINTEGLDRVFGFRLRLWVRVRRRTRHTYR
jgi:hypothetical protein